MDKQTASYLYLQDIFFIKQKFFSIYEYRRLNAILTYFYYPSFSRIQFYFVKTNYIAIIVHPDQNYPASGVGKSSNFIGKAISVRKISLKFNGRVLAQKDFLDQLS